MTRFPASAVLAAVLLAVFSPLVRGADVPASQPVPIVQLGGKPAEMGAQYGQNLKEPIGVLHQQYLNAFFPGLLHQVAIQAAVDYDGRIRPEHRDEIRAMAGAIGMDWREVMLGNCFLDILPMLACSTISLPAGAAPDGVARMGRNLDFPSRNVAQKEAVLLVYRPEGKNAFAAITWPGMVGVLSGMNEHGLVLCNMEVMRMYRKPAAMPYVLLYRCVLEQCKTVDEAVKFLDRADRQTSNNVMLMDAAGNRAVVEITPKAVTVRKADEQAALISTNHQRGQDMDTPGRCRRYDTLHDGAKADWGKIDEKRIETFLGQAAQGRMTIQSMVFEPSNRVLYLSVGHDAAHGQFTKIDLKPLFAAKDEQKK